MNRARVLTVFFSGAGCWRIDLIDGFVGLNGVLCFVWREDFLPFDAYFFFGFLCFGVPFSFIFPVFETQTSLRKLVPSPRAKTKCSRL